MKIVCIADIHGSLSDLVLPEGDVLVIAGDITGGPDVLGQWGRRHESLASLARLAGRLRALPYAHKIIVAGNHDGVLANDRGVRLLDGLIYLQDSGCTIDGVRFWGIPWTPSHGDNAFCMSRHSLKLHYAAVPAGTDVLVCHARPPLREIRHAAPRLVVFGHSASRPRWKTMNAASSEVTFISASIGSGRPEGPIVAGLSSSSPEVSLREIPFAESITPIAYARRMGEVWRHLVFRTFGEAGFGHRQLLPGCVRPSQSVT